MIYTKTIESLNWYRIEASRIESDEIVKILTDTSGASIISNNEVSQIMLLSEGDIVWVYIGLSAQEDIMKQGFNNVIEKQHEDPLTIWSAKMKADSAFQIIDKYPREDVERQDGDPVTDLTAIQRLIRFMQGSDTPRLVNITLVADSIEKQLQPMDDDIGRYQMQNRTDEDLNIYLWRATEIIGQERVDNTSSETSSSSLKIFTQLSTSNHRLSIRNCKIKKAVRAIVYGKIQYKGKNTGSLVGEDLDFLYRVK